MTRMSSTRNGRLGSVPAALATFAALAIAGLVLGACSSSGSSSSESTGASGSTGSGGSGAASNFLQQLQQKASSATHATFKATYTSTNGSSSSTETLTFAQKGSKSSFTSGTTTVYSEGTTSTICDNSNSPSTCTVSSGGVNPLAGLFALFSPSGVASAIQAAAAAAAGVTVSHSSETHGGQASQCVSYSRGGQGIKYCVNGDGVVTYIGTPSGTFELTSYTTSVSDADVSVPAGATTVTLPSGVSIP
jgi:hypothetical protein